MNTPILIEKKQLELPAIPIKNKSRTAIELRKLKKIKKYFGEQINFMDVEEPEPEPEPELVIEQNQENSFTTPKIYPKIYPKINLIYPSIPKINNITKLTLSLDQKDVIKTRLFYEDNDNFILSIYGGSNPSQLNANSMYKVKRQSEKQQVPNKNKIMRDKFGMAPST